MTDLQTKALNTAVWFAAGFVVCLLFCRPWEDITDVLPVKTVAEIKQEVAAEVNPAEDRIKALLQERAKLVTDNKTMEQKLFAAWQENKRLKGIAGHFQQISDISTKSVEDFDGNSQQTDCSEIANAAALSDSICADVINNLHDQIGTQDSIDHQRQVQIAAFIKGLENMADNSLQKDAVIKGINKKLKWQKAQNLGLKAIVITAAVFILKNNL